MMSLRQNEEEKKQWEEDKRMAGIKLTQLCKNQLLSWDFVCLSKKRSGKNKDTTMSKNMNK